MSKPEHYPVLTTKLDLTPTQLHGALKQDAHDLALYLDQNTWGQVDCRECKKHLEVMIQHLGHLNTMQATAQAAIAANAEAQAPGTTKN